MAIRLTRIISSSSSSLLRRSPAPENLTFAAMAVGHGGGPTLSRPSSSSSSLSPSSSLSGKSEKTEKKLVDRLSAVIDAVNDRKLPPELRGQRNSVRSETDIINVVEQRIWHSMEEGQFDNLPGKGKPLNLSTNPHADPAEDTLYRILSKNGCAPEWVELNKEIRSKVSEWRLSLKRAWTSKCNGDYSKWNESSEALKHQLRDINDKCRFFGIILLFLSAAKCLV
ncbi:dnaJ homolog subfamily C member 28 isoform X2 [Morus notabilis]|uniref:dnaJ homolog subfamily C member 28 isoform X2 n=1 Tax=Morus notabilis TaxID=981085 RepID=UPI000CED3742|nr:dnaJ homolog subfamily C member 28 isoform X2 [Morus notabilis]